MGCVELGHERERGGAFAVAREQCDDVGLCVEARAVLREVVGDDGVEVLAQEFVARVLDDVVGLRREADDEQTVAARTRDFGEYVGRRFERESERRRRLLYLAFCARRGPVVCDRGGCDEDACPFDLAQHGGAHLLSRARAQHAHARWRGRRR